MGGRWHPLHATKLWRGRSLSPPSWTGGLYPRNRLLKDNFSLVGLESCRQKGDEPRIINDSVWKLTYKLRRVHDFLSSVEYYVRPKLSISDFWHICNSFYGTLAWTCSMFLQPVRICQPPRCVWGVTQPFGARKRQFHSWIEVVWLANTRKDVWSMIHLLLVTGSFLSIGSHTPSLPAGRWVLTETTKEASDFFDSGNGDGTRDSGDWAPNC